MSNQDLIVPPNHPPCRAGTGRCEFSTITASQLSTAVIILAYVVIRIAVAVLAKNTDENGIQLTIVSAFTIIYIFICLLLIEDVYISTLRDLPAGYRWTEFLLRVAVLMVLSILPTFLDAIPTLPSRTTPADRTVDFLIILYVMFLSWDAVVYWGGSAVQKRSPDAASGAHKIARRFSRTDGAGIILLIAAAGSSYASAKVGAVVLIAFILFAFWFQIRKAGKELINSRFNSGFTRDMLR